MIERRHLNTDALTGAVETFYYDHSTDDFHIERVEDAEPLIELTKASFNDAPSNWAGDWHHVASLPGTIISELAKQGILAPGGRVLDMDRFRAWLNDRDNRAFRTRPGKI